jgi:hypothetical protein
MMNTRKLTETSEAIKTIEVQGVRFEVLAYDRKTKTSLVRSKACGFWSYDVGYFTKRCQAYTSWRSFDCAVEAFEKEART